MQDALGALPEDLSPRQICEMLGTAAIDARSDEGRRIRRTMTRGLAHLIAKELLQAARQGHRGRSSAAIKTFYNHRKDATSPLRAAKQPRLNDYSVGDVFVTSMRVSTAKYFAMQRIADVVTALNPETLCEVGCGSGRNLFYLASKFPSLQCDGYELAATRVNIAKQGQATALANTELASLYQVDVRQMDNIKRINFVEASAFDIPAPDQGYDVVLTCEALEQMQLGLGKALSELRRISRQYVLMYEPFADVNGFLQRTYLWSRNYFRTSVHELRAHGLEPVKLWEDFRTSPLSATLSSYADASDGVPNGTPVRVYCLRS
jgi:ubiquinone/menaquinone biosynthesis C-methylase UbiE